MSHTHIRERHYTLHTWTEKPRRATEPSQKDEIPRSGEATPQAQALADDPCEQSPGCPRSIVRGPESELQVSIYTVDCINRNGLSCEASSLSCLNLASLPTTSRLRCRCRCRYRYICP